jgi:hypothetical protein
VILKEDTAGRGDGTVLNMARAAFRAAPVRGQARNHSAAARRLTGLKIGGLARLPHPTPASAGCRSAQLSFARRNSAQSVRMSLP